MKEINVAELLRNCPSGMKLDSTMYENIVFDKIIEDDKNFPIRVIRSEDGLRMSLTKYGQYSDIDSAKCIIFPEGKTTWKGFHRPFKDGDIIHVCSEYSDATFNDVAILKQIEKGEKIHCYCFYNYEEDYFNTNDFLYDDNTRFATEEEKEKLFKVIKDNGFEWNPETKTLDKLIESKEDIDDRVVMSGIYFDRENYADEVELHLNNYEIEIRDGKTYAIFKNQETKNSKPRFKVGDKIKSKSLDIINPIEIASVTPRIYTFTNGSFQRVEIIDKDYELINKPKFKVGDRIKYIYFDRKVAKVVKIHDKRYELDNGKFIEFKDENAYEISYDKFDVSTLKPFDKVLARCSTLEKWRIQLFEKYNKTFKHPFICMGYNKYKYCIPYEGNEHLLDTADDCDEYFN